MGNSPIFYLKVPLESFAPGSDAHEFFKEHGFRKWREIEDGFSSERGHMIGNFLSFKMTNLIAFLFVRTKDYKCAELFVDFRYQDLTEFNQVFFALELWGASMLSGIAKEDREEAGQLIKESFEKHRELDSRAARDWLFSNMRLGRFLNDEGKAFAEAHFIDWFPTGPVRWGNF